MESQGRPEYLAMFTSRAVVAVREGGDDEALAQAAEPADGVGPRVEAVPDAVQMVGLGFVEGIAKFAEKLVELGAVEGVGGGEGALATPDLADTSDVPLEAPAIGEGFPVSREALAIAEDGRDLADDGATPIDDGAEDIEGEGADIGKGHGVILPDVGGVRRGRASSRRGRFRRSRGGCDRCQG